MICKRCGIEMEYDGSGYDVEKNERHEWWYCNNCKHMDLIVKP